MEVLLSRPSSPVSSASRLSRCKLTLPLASYVDICPTGLTIVVITNTTTVYPESKTLAVPSGWTTTVTVCGRCGPAPTTLTLTKPIGTANSSGVGTVVVGHSSPAAPVAPSTAPAAACTQAVSTFSVLPIPASQYGSSGSAVCSGIGGSSSPGAAVAGQGTGYPVKPIAAAEVHNNSTAASNKPGPTSSAFSKTSSALIIVQYGGAYQK
jgi:hypothetical protein